MRALPILAGFLGLSAGVARADSPYHAVLQPLPELRSPMPSLPPPTPAQAPEVQPGLAPVGDGSYVWRGIGFVAEVDPDGRVHFVGGDDVEVGPWSLSWGGYGSQVHDKNEMLKVTFDDRVRLRAHAESVRMRAALESLPDYLFAIWRWRGWSYALRRQILFQLWDECAEEGEGFRVAGGRSARHTIEEFVRTFLPENSPYGYRRDELARLNARRESRDAFTPYVVLTASIP